MTRAQNRVENRLCKNCSAFKTSIYQDASAVVKILFEGKTKCMR